MASKVSSWASSRGIVITSSASSGPSTRSSFLVTTTRYCTVRSLMTRSSPPYGHHRTGRSPRRCAGIGPTSERASTHSSHGHTAFSSSSSSPNHHGSLRVDLRGMRPQRAAARPLELGDVDPGGDPGIVIRAVEPRLVERRLSELRRSAPRAPPASGPVTRPCSRASTVGTARRAPDTSRGRRRGRTRAPRCRAP